MRKVINLLSILVMTSANIITPFSYAELETIEQPIEEEPVVEQPVEEEPVVEQPVEEEHIETIEPEFPIELVVESGGVVSMSGLNDDEHGAAELPEGEKIDVEEEENHIADGIINENNEKYNKDLNSLDLLNSNENIIKLNSIEPQGEEILVTKPLLGDNDEWNNNFKYRTITITGTDGREYVLMDRNLGAKEPWDGETWGVNSETNYYGYHYQRGNNRGFSSQSPETQEGPIVVEPDQMPSKFHNSVWITTNPRDNGDSSNNNNYNLRGHKTDTDPARQGPCPDGRHIPSDKEWKSIFDAWSGSTDKSKDKGTDSYNFAYDLKLPPAGMYYNNFNVGAYGYYRSSTSYFRTYGSLLLFYSNYVNPQDFSNRTAGYSIRCLKNYPPIILEFHANEGYFSGGTSEIQHIPYYKKTDGGNYVTEINIQNPDRTGYMFDGRYLTGIETEWTGYVDDLTTIRDIYAKWLPFEDLDIKDSSGNVLFTIMDRNLGATTGNILDENSYGNYYQWGNNYGFRSGDILKTSSNQVDASKYGPGNYYKSNTFITRSQDYYGTSYTYRWDSTDNANLRGGSGDSSVIRGEGTDFDRQGPCPIGYHIPSTVERKAMYNLWCNTHELDCINNKGLNFSNKLNLPLAGHLYSINTNNYDGGSNGYYRSSSYNDKSNAYFLYSYSSDVYPTTYTMRSHGQSLRCLKNSTHTNSLIFSVDGEDVETKNFIRWEPILESYIPETPQKDNGAFIGWYENNNDEKFVFSSDTFISKRTILNAKFKCNYGYIENEEGTSCEKIGVEFNANSGEFNGGTGKIMKYVSIIQTPQYVTKIMHTKNLTDSGDYITLPRGQSLENGLNYDITGNDPGNLEISAKSTGFVQIEGADKLNVFIKYGGSSYCGSSGGPIGIRSGEEMDHEPHNSSDLNTSVRTTSTFPSYGSFLTDEFIMEGDSFNIAQGSSCPGYGWYTIISGTGIVESLQYPEDSFDNIEEPIRGGYIFKGWHLEDGTKFNPENIPMDRILRVYAEWEESSSNNSYSGGGKKWPSNNTQHNASIEEAEIETIKVVDNQYNDNKDSNKVIDNESNDNVTNNNNTNEQKESYSFAKSNGITTTSSIKEAKMNTSLKRIEMAKMLSYYAINVLGQEPDTSKGIVKFNDVSNKMDKQYDNGVTLSYQLGIMGQNMPKNNFRPNDEVTRAEFVTALSRMIYNTQDGKGNVKYYEPHMAKLYNEGIISNTNPKMKEKRGYVMTMLMRTAK